MLFDTSKIQSFWFSESASKLKTTKITSFGVASLVQGRQFKTFESKLTKGTGRPAI